WLLMQWMSYGGLALATSIAATIHMLTMLWLLRKRLKGIEGGRLLTSVGRIVAASAAAALGGRFVRGIVENHYAAHAEKSVAFHALVTLSVCLSVSLVIYVGLAIALRMEEWVQVRSQLGSLRRKLVRARA